MKTASVLALAICLNALANIMIKVGMLRTRGMRLELGSLLRDFALNPAVALGAFSFALALVCYGYVLSRMNLSVAYPIMTSMGYAIVVLASVVLLGEHLSPVQVIGLIAIVAGVWLVASG
ncbi:MAG TPA: small multidrug resistance protein [Candidatus Latescibacteria bacterium]|nr:small multidrug resistance protein [Candidatus Latescibacterota bacterium]